MYATPALLLKVRQISELNMCWNMVIRKLFGYHKWESMYCLKSDQNVVCLYKRYIFFARP